MTQRVAVYGTLKKDFNNHRVLGDEAKFVGSGVTKESYSMTGLNWVPMVYRLPATGPVKVEVYDVPDKQLIKGPIDRLEANGIVYKREKTLVVMGEEEETEAWLYFSVNKQTKKPDQPNDEGNYDWKGIQRISLSS